MILAWGSDEDFWYKEVLDTLLPLFGVIAHFVGSELLVRVKGEGDTLFGRLEEDIDTKHNFTFQIHLGPFITYLVQ